MRKNEPILTVETIGMDAPIRLSVAARLAFPDGSMTVSGLRKEAARGRLVIERIAGKDYCTLANIERMRQLCRVERKVSDCGFVVSDSTRQRSVEPPGSSSTAKSISPQDALRAKLRRRKPNWRNTSRQNTSPSVRSGT